MHAAIETAGVSWRLSARQRARLRHVIGTVRLVDATWASDSRTGEYCTLARKTQESYRRGTARHSTSVEIFWTLREDRTCNGCMTLKDSHGYRKWCCAICYYAMLLLVCSKDVSILHRFRDITTSTVYVTACDLEKSFSFDTTVELYATYAFWLVSKYILANTCYIFTGMKFRKVSYSKSDAPCRWRSFVWVSFDGPRMISH